MINSARKPIMYVICKEFSFAYAHRLMGDVGKCKNIHGHTGKVCVYLKSENLDEKDMVCHFDNVKNSVGKWIEENLDHKLLLNKNDPLTNELERLGEKFVSLDFNPTAEKIAQLIFERCKKMGMTISSVEVWESETAMGRFEQ